MKGKIVVCYNLNDSGAKRRYQLEKTLEKYDFEKVENIDTLWEKEAYDYEVDRVEKELLDDLKEDMKEKHEDELSFDFPELYVKIYFSRLNNTFKKIRKKVLT